MPFIVTAPPKTPKDILNRLNEIIFNASLMREIRGLVHIHQLTAYPSSTNPFTEVRLHCIQNEEFMGSLGADSKYNTDWTFLREVREVGNETAHKWVKENYHHLGKETTMDLAQWRMDAP